MKHSTISWILAVVFFTTSILFACLYLSEKHSRQRTQTALDMTEKSEAELRSSVQAAIVQSDKKEQASAVCGIYYCENVRFPNPNQVDLRSDGTAVFFVDFGGASGEKPRPKTSWQMTDDAITVGATTFKTEQGDLIDSKGNRWLHIR